VVSRTRTFENDTALLAALLLALLALLGLLLQLLQLLLLYTHATDGRLVHLSAKGHVLFF
jgi:hypothetical protein